MQNRYKKFVSDFFVFLLGSFGTSALSFLMVPFYTGILTPSEYGTIDLINTTSTLLLPVITMGLLDAVFRFTMSKDTDHGDVFTIGFWVVLTGGALCAAFLLCANLFLRWQYMWWMFAYLIVLAFYTLFSNFTKASQKIRLYVAAGILQTFLMLSLNILFLSRFRMGIWGYNMARIISFATPALLLFLIEKLYGLIRFRVDFAVARRMLKYSAPLIFTALAWWIISSSDKYMILYFYDEAQVGLYSVACKIPLILQTIVSILLTVQEITLISVYEEERAELRAVVTDFVRWFQGIGFILGSGLLLSCQLIMRILAKNEFYEGWRFAPLLILSGICPFISSVSGVLYRIFQRNKGDMVSVILGALINILLNLWWLPAHGVMGASASTLVSRLFIMLYKMKDTEQFLKFERRYGFCLLNSAILILQTVFLLKMSRHVFAVQFVIFFFILFLNRGIIREGWRWGMSRIRRARAEKGVGRDEPLDTSGNQN